MGASPWVRILRRGLVPWAAHGILGGKLTVVAFHRVLAAADARAPEANPEWTLETSLFARSLECLARRFNFVAEADVIAFYAGRASLPRRALLVTFDDGWRDNFDYALDPLVRAGVPALFFVSSAYVGSHAYYWQEALYAAFAPQLGRGFTPDETAALAAAGVPIPGLVWGRVTLIALIRALNQAPMERRAQALAALRIKPASPRGERLFMDATELKRLIAKGMAVGAHGDGHEPFTRLADAEAEARRSRETLETLTGAPIRTMSYPHGAVDALVKEACRRSGFSLAFCSRNGANERGTDPFALQRHFLPNWRQPVFPQSGLAGSEIDFDIVWELAKAGHA